MGRLFGERLRQALLAQEQAAARAALEAALEAERKDDVEPADAATGGGSGAPGITMAYGWLLSEAAGAAAAGAGAAAGVPERVEEHPALFVQPGAAAGAAVQFTVWSDGSEGCHVHVVSPTGRAYGAPLAVSVDEIADDDDIVFTVEDAAAEEAIMQGGHVLAAGVRLPSTILAPPAVDDDNAAGAGAAAAAAAGGGAAAAAMPAPCAGAVHLVVDVRDPTTDAMRAALVSDNAAVRCGGAGRWADARGKVPRGGGRVVLRLAPASGSTAVRVAQLPRWVLLELLNGEAMIASARAGVVMRDHVPGLFLEPGEAPSTSPRIVNALVFGGTGQGKSTLINSLYRAVSNSATPVNRAHAAPSADHVTVSYHGYRLCDLPNNRFTRVNLWDTWGLDRNTNTNYNDGQFEQILEGKMPRDTQRDDVMRRDDVVTPPTNAVVFVLSAAEADAASPLLRMLKTFKEKVANRVPIVVAMTCCDTVLPEGELFPRARHDAAVPAAIATRIATIAHGLGLEQTMVFPVVSYTDQTLTHAGMNRNLLALLQTILDVADENRTSAEFDA